MKKSKYLKGLAKTTKDYTKSFLDRIIDGFFGLLKIIAILVAIILGVLVVQCGILLIR